MSVELVEKFLPYVDEQFATESKKDLLTNQDFDWEGAHSVRIYKITTSKMNDYGRSGPDTGNWSRYGAVDPLSATTERMALKKDRSFTFAIDKLDQDETAQQLEAAKALARQNREVTIPEVDTYTYGVMCANAGHKPEAKALTATNIYVEILAASQALDDAEVPETDRVLVVTPATYALMKKCKDIAMETDVGNELRLQFFYILCGERTGQRGCYCLKLSCIQLEADDTQTHRVRAGKIPTRPPGFRARLALFRNLQIDVVVPLVLVGLGCSNRKSDAAIQLAHR